MGGHHLILGELADLVTGATLPDTHDERYRQKIARLLLEQKGYLKRDIHPRIDLLVQADARRALIKVDFLVKLGEHPGLLIKYGPGSLVTRRRPALAAARLVATHQVPVVVVTNGEEAEILDGATGKVVAEGLAAIPDRTALADLLATHRFEPVPAVRAQMESRIAYCYEVDGACPCDDTVCRL
jgi:hypothetical protein